MEIGTVEKPETVETKTAELNFDTLALARDLFMFSFYTQGMSFSDVANLKKENIKNGAICYERKKTGQTITIEIEKCIKTIIDRYADPNSIFIFPILRNCENGDESAKWSTTAAALSAYNRNLRKLAPIAGIGERLTSYVARHSWASLASQEGVPIGTISRGMGHESEKTTQIYISQLDCSDVKIANRRIIAKILERA
jgi:integrase